MLILIRLLRQKPADLNLQCFQKQMNPDSAGQLIITFSKGELMSKCWTLSAWPRGYKTFFVLSSTEFEILTPHKN